MDYYNVEFAMPGYGGGDDEPYKPKPTGDLARIVRQAGDMLVRKQFTGAIDVLEVAVKDYPCSIHIHKLLGMAYVETKRIPEAKREWNRLSELGVKEPKFALKLAALSLGKRYFEDAISLFREAERLGAEPGDLSILLGNALCRTGRLDEAEEVYQEALPDSDIARYDQFFGLSTIRLQQEQYQEAVELGMHALRTNKAKTRVVYFLGLTFMRMGDSERALEFFRRFLRMEPKYVATYRWLERLTREAGDDEEADRLNLKAREVLEERRLKRWEKRRNASETTG